jgi:ABC-type multidrug transport system fused ATPase/permease subunit
LIYPGYRLTDRDAQSLVQRCSRAITALRRILESSSPERISVIVEEPTMGDAGDAAPEDSAADVVVRVPYEPERPELAPEMPLVHAMLTATLGTAADGVAVWDEGFALYIASLPGASAYHNALVDQCVELQEKDRMPPLMAIIAGSDWHVSTLATTVAAGFIRYLVETHGERNLGRFLRALRHDPVRAFTATYKQDLAIADRNWRRLLASKRSVTWTSTHRAIEMLLPFLTPLRLQGVMIVLFSLVGIAFSLALPLSFRLLIDNILGRRPLDSFVPMIGEAGEVIGRGDEQIHALFVLLGALTLLFIANAGSRVQLTSTTAAAGELFLCQLRERMLSKLSMLPTSYFAHTTPADVSQRVMVDSTAVQQAVVNVVIPLFTSAIALVIYGGALIAMEPRLSVIAIGGLPALGIIYRLRRNAIRDASRERVKRVSTMTARIIELVNLNVLSKVYVAGPYLVGQLQLLLRMHRQLNVAYSRESAIYSQSATLVTHLLQVAVLFVGGYLVVTTDGNDLAAGGLAAFYILLNQVFAPIAQITASRQALIETSINVERICELLEEPVEQDDASAGEVEPLRNRLTIESLSFGYLGNRQVLHNLSIEIPAGGTVAFVGPTGCGKTSLAVLLPRLYDPWEGSIRWDGHDIRHVRLESLRRQVALVPQDAPILSASVYENIVFGMQGANSEDVIAAARAAEADAFIQHLPDGYDTILGDRGHGLSGGQKQRIALARALLRNPSVLILDEATSALDPTTQSKVQAHLRDGRPDRTIVKIAHRLETVADADNIVVFQDGRVAEHGHHTELLNRHGLYARLFHDQMRLLDEAGGPTIAQVIQWLKRSPRFSTISSEVEDVAQDHIHTNHFREGEIIVPSGERPRAVSVVGRGRAELVMIDDAGQETVVGSLGAGDLIGADDENAHGPRKTMVRAATDVQIFSFELTRA